MKKHSIVFIILNIWFGCALIAGTIFYFSYNATSHKPRQVSHSYTYFNVWEQVHDDGTREKIELPCAINAKNDHKLVLEAVLPDNLTEADWFNISNGFDLDIYIDGVLRKSFRETDDDIPGGVVKGIKQFCKLSQEDSGKVIRVERPSNVAYGVDILIGDSLGIVSYYLFKDAVTYIADIFLFIVALVGVLFGLIVRVVEREPNSLIPLSLGVALGALWLLFDSSMYQFVFDNYYIDGPMSYIVGTLMPFPFLLCVNHIQNRRHNTLNMILGAVLLTVSTAVSILHFNNIADFERSQLVSNGITVIVLATVVCLLIIDMVKKRVDNLVQVYGLFLGLVCGCIEAFMLNIVQNRTDGTFVMIGLWIILVSALIQQILNLWHSEQEKQRAIHANHAKSEFLAKMSHEIRTPINAVLGMDEMILRECKDEEIVQYASDIKVATNNLLTIINEILDSSKIESGKMQIIEGEYKMAILLNDLYNMTFIKAEEKQLSLIFNVDENIPSAYYGDDVRIRQILVNLLTNAVKYTEKGEVCLKLSMNRRNDKAILRFSVKDTGIGIKEKDLTGMFTEYQRVDENRNRYIEGTGLGMSIAMQLLKMMKSELKVKSTYGKGSEFYFELEQGIVDATPLGDFKTSAERRVAADETIEFEAPAAKALVVDDNLINRKVFSLLLKNKQMQITEAAGGRECLEYIADEHYDIIFLDHMMPEMDGIEVLKALPSLQNNKNMDTPIVMFTANALNGAEEFYHENGADDYLAKPIKPEKLDEILLKYLKSELIVK